MTKLGNIVFETDRYWVKRVPKGYEVYKIGLTHSTRVAVIGYTGDKGLERAKQEIARREAAGHATKRKAAPPAPFPLGPPRSKAAAVIVYSRPSGYWYAQARDAATGTPITDATDYSRKGVLQALRGKFAMIGVTIESITDEDPYASHHAASHHAASHHAAKKKSAVQLEREINEALNRKVARGEAAPYEGMRVQVTKYGAMHHGLRAGVRGVIKRVASPDVRFGPATSRASVLVDVHGAEFSTQWPTAALRVVK